MKKSGFMFFIIMLISLSLFAAKVTLPDPAQLKVVVTGNRKEVGAFDFGFCSNKISKYEDTPKHFTGDVVPDLGVGLDADGNTVAKSEPGTLFLYWRLLTDKPVDFQLSISGPLNHDTYKPGTQLVKDDPKVLDWKVKWPINSTIPAVVLDSTKNIDYMSIKKYTPPLSGEAEGGSIPIEIETYPVIGKYFEGRYSGNLKLKVIVK